MKLYFTAILILLLGGFAILAYIWVASFAPIMQSQVTSEVSQAKSPKVKPVATTEKDTASDKEMQLIAEHNDFRADHGLNTLSINAQLMHSAQLKADDLCGGVWSHTDSQGREPWGFFADAGYTYQKAGENLAYGFPTQAGAFQGLLDSPTHYENIVGEYLEIGVGFNECNGKNYSAVHYGSR